MNKMIKVFLCTILLVCFISGQANVYAQSIPEASGPTMDCEGTIRAWVLSGYYRPGDCHCENGRPVCNKSPSGAKSSGSKAAHHSAQMKAMIVGTIFESLLTSLFATDTSNSQAALAAQQQAAALAAQQAAAAQRAQAAAAQAEYERMMRSYKQLDGTQGAAFKTLSDSSLAMKSLDGDAETLAANARKPFDTALALQSPPLPETTGNSTPFFGDTMPIEDIQTLVNPEKDPRVVDLGKAVSYVVDSIKNDSAKIEESIKPYDGNGNGEPITRDPACSKIADKLNRFIKQRANFQKTINFSQEQYATWKTANRNALLNAAKDGLEYFTGQLLDGLSKREKVADRLQEIATQMAQDGLNISEIQARIDRLRTVSSIAKSTSNTMDWQTFMKDGISGLLNQLTSSNNEIQEMFQDPKMQKYFEKDSPELSVLLDISKIAAANKVFGKWVLKKVPLIAAIELSINQTYNALDWYLSFTHIVKANKINGEVLYAAKSLQKHIDDTSLELRECPR